jgi:PhzF family phenazine biosynthesis protein
LAIRLFHVDAFTGRRFAGNPAAVCLLSRPAEELWMQRVAAEMNLSETAFLNREGERFWLRWFTPKVEVNLCGHATLASAHILWEEGIVLGKDRITFHTKSGELCANRRGPLIELDFPAMPPVACELPKPLSKSLGVIPKYAGKNQDDYLLEIRDEDQLRSLSPDFGLLSKVGTRGVIVTCPSKTAYYDFVSRFFAPAVGVNEDPVTGSAHCCLGPFWGKKLGKNEMVGYQASPRGGVVRVRLRGDRVVLGGQAITVSKGELVR